MRRLSLPALVVATLIGGPLLLSGQVSIERGNTFGPLNADTICLDSANRDACLSRAAANILQLDAGDSLNLNPAGVRISTDGDGSITFLGLGNGSDEDFTVNLDDTANTADFSSSTGLNTWTLTGLTTINFGAAGVRFTQDEDGALTLLGLGNGSDEDLTFNFDDNPNSLDLASSTGVVQITWTGSIIIGAGSSFGQSGRGDLVASANGQWVFRNNAGDTAAAVLSRLYTEAVTTTRLADPTESGAVFTNTGDADGSTHTLPNNPTIGLAYRYIATVAQTMIISPSAGETINDNGSVCADVRIGAAIGEAITLVAATGGAGAMWVPLSSHGGFTCTP